MRKMNTITSIAILLFSYVAQSQPGSLPTNQEPGKCYAECVYEDQYQTTTEQVLVKPASKRVVVFPAEFETVSEQVMTQAAARRIEKIPAIYENVEVQVRVGCPETYMDDGTRCTKVVEVPAEYETVKEMVLIKEASKQFIQVPPVYEIVTEQVVVKEPSTRAEIVPTEFETETIQVMTKEASTRVEKVPALYISKRETIEVTPATSKWVKTKINQNCLSNDPNDCFVWSKVEVPAEYRTITKQIRNGCPQGYVDQGDDCTRTVEIPAEYETYTYRKVKSFSSTRTVDVPAEFASVSKRQLKTAASVRQIEIPAEYKSIDVLKVKTPATTRTIEIPAEYKNVVKRVRIGCPEGFTDNGDDCIRFAEIPAEYTSRSYQKVKTPTQIKEVEIPAEFATVTKKTLVKQGGYTVWKEVLCEDQINGNTIYAIQRALKNRNYDVGNVDQVLGSQTKAALTQFQRDNGLPIGQLDVDTLNLLGVYL